MEEEPRGEVEQDARISRIRVLLVVVVFLTAACIVFAAVITFLEEEEPEVEPEVVEVEPEAVELEEVEVIEEVDQAEFMVRHEAYYHRLREETNPLRAAELEEEIERELVQDADSPERRVVDWEGTLLDIVSLEDIDPTQEGYFAVIGSSTATDYTVIFQTRPEDPIEEGTELYETLRGLELLSCVYFTGLLTFGPRYLGDVMETNLERRLAEPLYRVRIEDIRPCP